MKQIIFGILIIIAVLVLLGAGQVWTPWAVIGELTDDSVNHCKFEASRVGSGWAGDHSSKGGYPWSSGYSWSRVTSWANGSSWRGGCSWSGEYMLSGGYSWSGRR